MSMNECTVHVCRLIEDILDKKESFDC